MSGHVTVNMYGQKIIPVRANRGAAGEIIMFKFRTEHYGTLTRNNVATTVRNYFEDYRDGNLQYMITARFPQGWRSSKWNDYEHVRTSHLELDYDADFADMGNQDQVRYFTVLVRRAPRLIGGNDIRNDCLYTPLLDAHGNYSRNLPTKIETPQKLKSFLKLMRNQKVPVESLKDLESLNLSLEVTGDSNWISTEKKPVHIKLSLKNEHFTLIDNNNKTKAKDLYILH